jgi:AcrR family transcriptional regulator
MNTLSATLRDRRRQQAVDEIAGVAHELFVSKGYDAVSVDDIAAAAGCSPRTFYRYFGAKEDVLFYDLPVLLDTLTGMLDGLLAEGSGPWHAVTEAMAGEIERFGDANERIASERMTLWLTEPVLRGRYMHYIAATEEAVTAALQNVKGATKRDKELAPLRAVAAVGAYRATLMIHHSDSDGRKLAKHFRAACKLIAAGLGDR